MPPTHAPPPPVEVDLARVVRVGMAAWAVALVVTVVLAVTSTTDWIPVAVCVTGIALGGLGLVWTRRRSR